jgi:hypothetical protein
MNTKKHKIIIFLYYLLAVFHLVKPAPRRHSLWAAGAYLAKTGNCIVTPIPAASMAVVGISSIPSAPKGFRRPYTVGLTTGLVVAAALFVPFIFLNRGKRKKHPER